MTAIFHIYTIGPCDSESAARRRISRVDDTLGYLATVEEPEVFTRPWTMNLWVSVKTTKELTIENACVELDIDHVTSFDEKTKR